MNLTNDNAAPPVSRQRTTEWPGFQQGYMREAVSISIVEQLEELIAQLRTEVRALQARLDDMDQRLGKGTV